MDKEIIAKIKSCIENRNCFYAHIDKTGVEITNDNVDDFKKALIENLEFSEKITDENFYNHNGYDLYFNNNLNCLLAINDNIEFVVMNVDKRDFSLSRSNSLIIDNKELLQGRVNQGILDYPCVVFE